jgi:hypothetical protein
MEMHWWCMYETVVGLCVPLLLQSLVACRRPGCDCNLSRYVGCRCLNFFIKWFQSNLSFSTASLHDDVTSNMPAIHWFLWSRNAFNQVLSSRPSLQYGCYAWWNFLWWRSPQFKYGCKKLFLKKGKRKVKWSRYAPQRRIWVTGGIAPTLS